MLERRVPPPFSREAHFIIHTVYLLFLHFLAYDGFLTAEITTSGQATTPRH
jgi:hypothetical protein